MLDPEWDAPSDQEICEMLDLQFAGQHAFSFRKDATSILLLRPFPHDEPNEA